MSANAQPYQVTTPRIAQGEASLARLQATPRPHRVPPHLYRAMPASMASQLAELRYEVADYEALQARKGSIEV